MEQKMKSFSSDYTMEYFTDAQNIPNQDLVRETIDWFEQGQGARAFDPLTLLNLVRGQLDYILIHKSDPEDIKTRLTALTLTPLQRHVLYGFILKWTGGYPVNNLDPQTHIILKELERQFVAYPENTPEKEFCKADSETAKQFRRLETLFNTHFKTGVPIHELEKEIFADQTAPAPQNFKRFSDLYQSAVDNGILPAPKTLSEQGLQIAIFETRFLDWLNQNMGWHYSDLPGLADHLMLENFLQFLTVGKQKTSTAIPSPLPATVDTPTHTTTQSDIYREDQELVFVTYSWDDSTHNSRVMSLTDRLRKEGYKAQIDRLFLQEQTAADLHKMMLETIHKAKKVVVVLSRGYKEKADNSEGGVGIEYNIIYKDIEENPRKYILISFEPFNKDIVPFGFKNRVVTPLTSPEGMDQLLHKLADVDEFSFSPVAPVKRILLSKTIEEFALHEKFSGNGPEVGEEGPWDGQTVRKDLVSAIEHNDTDGLKNLLQQNSFLFYELVARKDFQQPVFYNVPLGDTDVVDFVWLNDNSDGPEWVLVKIGEPGMAVMEGSIPAQTLSRTMEMLISWERSLMNKLSLARSIFGAVSKLRLVLVAGTTGSWQKPIAMQWRADNNKNGRIEIRSSNVFIKSADYYLEKPGAFYGPRQYPQTLPPSQLEPYWRSYGYMQHMVMLFGQ